MATHSDIVEAALLSLGLIRFGQSPPGELNAKALSALQYRLRALHEARALDFDPLDADAVPDERVPQLVDLFLQEPILRPFNPQYDPTGTLREEMRRVLYRSVNPEDHLDQEVYDF